MALHAATVLSTIVVLWSEVWRLLKGLFSRRFNAEQAYVLKLVLSMIPIGVIRFLFKDRINAMLDAPYILVIVGAMLLLTATLLAFAYYAKPRQKETISYRDALIIGLAQACAAMPGLSRSGTTIATGLLLGNKKAAVAQFSILMVLAPILGETLLEAVSGDLTAGVAAGPLAAGFLASFITGCLACKFMIEIVKRILPQDKPRYLMGVGTPENILEGIQRGVDMFDCVMPTRTGRNGMIFITEGTINIKNQKWERDFSSIDPAA